MMPHDAASRVPPWLHHALFVLFLLGILGYGGSFAFYMLTKFDLINLIRDTNYDDAFYYYEIAKNLAEGKFSTFDGGITRTNGYHPLWMLLITPFYWICDPVTALFGIKAFEIMLVTGAVVLVVLAARVARLPWILLFAALPMLLNRRHLMIGMEAAAALFTLGVLFLVLSLFARDPLRWKWPLAVTVFTLPWARLEYVAISMAATGALCLIEWSRRKESLGGGGGVWSLGVFISSLSSLRSVIPFAGACAGILSYFAYNGVVFGGLVPVSGAAKLIWSQNYWTNSEYSFLQNFQDMMQRLAVGPSEFLAALEVCAYILVVWWFGRRSRRREDDLLLGFLVGVFSLGVGHLGQFMYAVLFMHPDVHAYSRWYYVPGYLLMALIVPVRCWVVVYFIRCLTLPKWHGVASVASVGVLVIGMIVMFWKVNVTGRYLSVDHRSKSLGINGHVSRYAGARMMNRILPEGSIVGSGDAGVIGYFSRFPVVGLDGLVNSYEYLRSADRASLRRSYGITHFANRFPAEWPFSPSGKAVFEGIPVTSSRRHLEFKLRFADPPWASSSAIDPVAWFWKRMEPHFDYQSQAGDVGVVIDGRLVLSFAKDCAPDERPSRRLLLQWTTEADETGSALQHPWRNEGEIPWVCGDASLLPKDTTLPVRIALTTEDDPHRALGSFEDGLDDWRLDGDAVTIEGQHERTVGQQPISGNVGRGFLNSYHPDRGDAVTGTARSPAFTTADGSLLTFLIAGGDGDGVGVRLLADGAEVNVWRGRDTEHFEEVGYLLSGLEGQTLQLELFDAEVGDWGHVMLDHVRLVQPDAAR